MEESGGEVRKESGEGREEWLGAERGGEERS